MCGAQCLTTVYSIDNLGDRVIHPFTHAVTLRGGSEDLAELRAQVGRVEHNIVEQKVIDAKPYEFTDCLLWLAGAHHQPKVFRHLLVFEKGVYVIRIVCAQMCEECIGHLRDLSIVEVQDQGQRIQSCSWVPLFDPRLWK